MIRGHCVVLRLAVLMIFSTACFAQSARQYYDELYNAGGLDHMADAFACFDDDPRLQTFFIFAESKMLREFMMADGSFARLDKDVQQKLKQDFLIVRGYDKGVSIGEEDLYQKDGSSWVNEKFVLSKQPKRFGRMRLNLAWESLRYKRSVEILNPDMSLKSQVARYGKCEEVSPAVRQRGNP
jgi:hypothetical protein